MKKKYQILNIITLSLSIVLCMFELFKIIYISSYRKLYFDEITELCEYFLCFTSIILLFISSTIYYKKKKLRIITTIFYCISIILFILYTHYNINKTISLYTNYLNLNNFYYFTYIFESIFASLFSLYLITTFIYKLATKYYKK